MRSHSLNEILNNNADFVNAQIEKFWTQTSTKRQAAVSDPDNHFAKGKGQGLSTAGRVCPHIVWQEVT